MFVRIIIMQLIVTRENLSLGHHHTAEICSENEHQTFYTDETRKQGETFASFITTDEIRNPY